MDCIRTIQAEEDPANVADYHGGETCGFYFSRLPRYAEIGDLMFTAYRGHVRYVGKIIDIDPRPDREGYSWITLGAIRKLKNWRHLEYKGYASIRYLDRLAKQYKAAYRPLAHALDSAAKDYRGGARRGR
jgi:hypothetical protein